MLLHLVRHAHALAEEENASRPLSQRGHGEVARLARFLATSGVFRPAQIWHSPLLRSRETADGLVRRLGLDVALVETSGLLPEDDPQEAAERLQGYPHDRGDLALVGHEPQLGQLASLLVRGKSSSELFVMKKAALLTLQLAGGTHKKTGLARWRVRWMLTPELLPATVFPLPPLGAAATATVAAPAASAASGDTPPAAGAGGELSPTAAAPAPI